VIWPVTFEDRLRAWHDLRLEISQADLPNALNITNDWWWQAPMVNRSIDLHHTESWPGPWELLAQSGFCSVARALAIAYTLLMADRIDIQHLDLISVADDNLVRVNEGKYILNWSPGSIVNNLSPESVVLRIVSNQELQRLIR
jgi:hypothetical protein